MQAGQRDLAAVGVAGKDQGDVVRPQPVRLLGDVGEAQGREVPAQPAQRLFAAGVAGVGVVQTQHLQRLVAEGDRGVLVGQHLGAAADQRVPDLAGAGPVVVVAQHRQHRRGELAHQGGQLVEVDLAVADEVAGDDHQVGPFGVGQRHRLPLYVERGHPSHVDVGQVGDADVVQPAHIAAGSGEAADPDARVRKVGIAVRRRKKPAGRKQRHRRSSSLSMPRASASDSRTSHCGLRGRAQRGNPPSTTFQDPVRARKPLSA